MKTNFTLGSAYDGLRLGLVAISPDGSEPAAVLQLSHGMCGCKERYIPFMEYMADHGVACVACDHRGHGESVRTKDDLGYMYKGGYTALVEDMKLVSDWTAGAFPDTPLVLLGHSMGGMLAPRIECCGGDFAGLILLAGSPRRLEEILLEQTREAIDGMKGLGRWITKKQLEKLEQTFAGLYDLPDGEAKAKKVGGGTTLYYFKDMGHPPVAYWLSKTAKPMLVMQGEKDVQVKASVDYQLYQELLGDRENVTFRLYPGLSHTFVPAIATSVAEAKKEFAKERHIGNEVLDDLAGWIGAQF